MKKALRVAIVGIGSAGQSSSILLKRQGHHVEVHTHLSLVYFLRGALSNAPERSSLKK
jgi:thioredoxin reductase